MKNNRELRKSLHALLKYVKTQWRRNKNAVSISGTLIRSEFVCAVRGSDCDCKRVASSSVNELLNLFRSGVALVTRLYDYLILDTSQSTKLCLYNYAMSMCILNNLFGYCDVVLERFGRSIDPIAPQEVTLTRVAITTEEDALKKKTEIGRKFIVPYALYQAEGYISANLARKVTHFSEDDLNLLWQAIINMFENDHSAARGNMAVRELIVFKHDSELGNAPSYKLFERVHVARKDPHSPARSYSDYEVHVDTENMPQGVTLERKI